MSADARAAGMADQGCNISRCFFTTMESCKICFFYTTNRVSVSYTPYLTDLAKDISLGQVTYYNKISKRSAFAGSLVIFGFWRN
jgi:hypothetical protein